jgi:hypothetical protein
MANNPFIVDNTIPGLGASDLANLIGATYVMAFGALAGTNKPGMLRALRRALRRLGTLRLRDLGLNRDAC